MRRHAIGWMISVFALLATSHAARDSYSQQPAPIPFGIGAGQGQGQGIQPGGANQGPNGSPGGAAAADFDSLIDLITSTVEADSWDGERDG